MADNDEFPRNYDFCVSVLSEAFPVLDLFHEDLDEKMKKDHPEIYGEDHLPLFPRTIVAYAQWVPFADTDVPDLEWFDRIEKGLYILPYKRETYVRVGEGLALQEYPRIRLPIRQKHTHD